MKNQNYQEYTVDLGKHRVKAYSYGEGDITLFILNGGPGLPCDYFLRCHLPLIERGMRIVSYDQLGTGKSDKPKDNSLWTIERYCDEVDVVRKALGLEKVHLLGHSWGAVLGIEYALKYKDRLSSLILADGVGDIPFHVSELQRLRQSLGDETVRMMQRREAEGTIEHPEYQAAITLLNYRHLCRLEEWPQEFIAALNNFNLTIYEVMQGPNEFCFTGNLKDWNRINEMSSITIPSLVLVGEYDELTPASATKMYHALANATLRVFRGCSHTPMIEDPESYMDAVEHFIRSHERMKAFVM